MKVYLCALAKNEHLYINEWVKHYIDLGFDKIFIFDNDDKNSPNIKDFISSNFLNKCRVINARGIHRKNMQGEFYSNFYNIEKDNFDWCLFCDIDEFLVGIDNIKSFLNKPIFSGTQQIRVKWKLFGDDNKIERDMSKGVMESFKKEITSPLSKDLTTTCKLHNQGKSIVKGRLNDIYFDSVHFATNRKKMTILPSVLPSGKKCFSGVEIKEDYSNESVFLNHYMTKSLSEFVKQKMNRTDAVFNKRVLDMNYYWRLNKKTPKKIKYLKDMGLDI